MDKLASNEAPFPKLSSDEILELERIYNDIEQKVLTRKLFEEIAEHFSSSSNGGGKTSLSWRQMWVWFNKRCTMFQNKDFSLSDLQKMSDDLADSYLLEYGKGKVAADIENLTYEARSKKDMAWHDVAMLLNFRNLSPGELEVLVRYVGFGRKHDEWINVKLGVRERSIQLKPSECYKVKDGHLVVCFLEKDDYALYFDARVLKIERKIHDETDCTCTFSVRFVHDNTEEEVSWNRIWCRPTQE